MILKLVFLFTKTYVLSKTGSFREARIKFKGFTPECWINYFTNLSCSWPLLDTLEDKTH